MARFFAMFLSMIVPSQNTLANPVTCVGVALHTGAKVTMTLKPAAEHSGIVFKRVDVTDRENVVPAQYDRVSETRLGTTISNDEGVSVSTIEHLMAAFWGCRVDNAIVELDGPEVPIMDGSSEPFLFLIECAGIKKQDAPRRLIRVKKRVEVQDGDKTISIEPSERFAVKLGIDFNSKVIDNQQGTFVCNGTSFKAELARARTFGFAHEVEALRAAGLARGGSLDNAIVIKDDKVLNEDGLRYGDEFVRHKILDCIGDTYLCGAYLQGVITGTKTGHEMNNKLLHALFADNDAWEEVKPEAESFGDFLVPFSSDSFTSSFAAA